MNFYVCFSQKIRRQKRDSLCFLKREAGIRAAKEWVKCEKMWESMMNKFPASVSIDLLSDGKFSFHLVSKE